MDFQSERASERRDGDSPPRNQPLQNSVPFQSSAAFFLMGKTVLTSREAWAGSVRLVGATLHSLQSGETAVATPCALEIESLVWKKMTRNSIFVSIYSNMTVTGLRTLRSACRWLRVGNANKRVRHLERVCVCVRVWKIVKSLPAAA